MLANVAQSNDEFSFLICIAECILACLASLVEYFNKVRGDKHSIRIRFSGRLFLTMVFNLLLVYSLLGLFPSGPLSM